MSAAARFSAVLLVLLVGVVFVLLYVGGMAVFEFYGALVVAVAIPAVVYMVLRRRTGSV